MHILLLFLWIVSCPGKWQDLTEEVLLALDNALFEILKNYVKMESEHR